MKLFRYVFLIIVILFTVKDNIEVSAMNTGLSTLKIDDTVKQEFINNINLSLIEEPIINSIQCFDVNDSKMIAIGHRTSNKKYICIYSNNGEFKYGFSFNCSGSFYVEWDKMNINIYFIRSDIIISVNSDGEVLDVLKVDRTIENTSYRNHFLDSTERTIGTTQYLIRNDMGVLNLLASSYSQLITRNSTGEESVLYDVNPEQYAKTLILCFISIISFLSIIVFFWRKFYKFKTNLHK